MTGLHRSNTTRSPSSMSVPASFREECGIESRPDCDGLPRSEGRNRILLIHFHDAVTGTSSPLLGISPDHSRSKTPCPVWSSVQFFCKSDNTCRQSDMSDSIQDLSQCRYPWGLRSRMHLGTSRTSRRSFSAALVRDSGFRLRAEAPRQHFSPFSFAAHPVQCHGVSRHESIDALRGVDL